MEVTCWVMCNSDLGRADINNFFNHHKGIGKGHITLPFHEGRVQVILTDLRVSIEALPTDATGGRNYLCEMTCMVLLLKSHWFVKSSTSRSCVSLQQKYKKKVLKHF